MLFQLFLSGLQLTKIESYISYGVTGVFLIINASHRLGMDQAVLNTERLEIIHTHSES